MRNSRWKSTDSFVLECGEVLKHLLFLDLRETFRIFRHSKMTAMSMPTMILSEKMLLWCCSYRKETVNLTKGVALGVFLVVVVDF